MCCTQPVLARVQHVAAAFTVPCCPARLVSSVSLGPRRSDRVTQHMYMRLFCACRPRLTAHLCSYNTACARKPEIAPYASALRSCDQFARSLVSFDRSTSSRLALLRSLLGFRSLSLVGAACHARVRGAVVEPALRACLAGCNAATRVQARGVSSFGCACAWGGVVGDVVARSDVHGASHWRGRGGLLVVAREVVVCCVESCVVRFL